MLDGHKGQRRRVQGKDQDGWEEGGIKSFYLNLT